MCSSRCSRGHGFRSDAGRITMPGWARWMAGYFLHPAELFHSLAARAAKTPPEFILDDLTRVLNNIESSTMGMASEDDFEELFEDLDLTSSKLGRTEKDKNALICKVLVHLDAIDFRLDESESDVLGDAYEYLIGQFASRAGKKAGEFFIPKQVFDLSDLFVIADGLDKVHKMGKHNHLLAGISLLKTP